MKVLICPNCNKKNFYIGRKKNPCVRCGTIIESDKCETITITKEPFIECPMCGTKYAQPVTKCTAKDKKWKSICGFDYNIIDNIEEIAKTNEEKERKQKEFSSQQLQQPLQPQPSNQVHCPYCNSTNVNKISSTKKAMSIIGFGILSNKIGKQWHCNNCKSDF